MATNSSRPVLLPKTGPDDANHTRRYTSRPMLRSTSTSEFQRYDSWPGKAQKISHQSLCRRRTSVSIPSPPCQSPVSSSALSEFEDLEISYEPVPGDEAGFVRLHPERCFPGRFPTHFRSISVSLDTLLVETKAGILFCSSAAGAVHLAIAARSRSIVRSFGTYWRASASHAASEDTHTR